MNIPGRQPLVKPLCSLSDDFCKLFESQDFADVILSASGQQLHAHKAVLSTRSPVFLAMFRHDMLETRSNRVEIEDIRYDVLREMVHFIYTGRTPNLIDMACELLQAADKYALERLKVMCEDTLCLSLTTDNVADTLILADVHSAKQLKERCLSFIAERAKDIIHSDGWKKILQSHPELVGEAFRTLAMQQLTSTGPPHKC
jgi:speckle-type POZ protein